MCLDVVERTIPVCAFGCTDVLMPTDEILDHPLRVPFLPFSEECLDLIRKMLDRDVDRRITIEDVMADVWLCEES